MPRRANGIAALLLLAVFSAHAIMGTLFCFGVVSGGLSWIVWIGVGVIAVHVALSVVTTCQMLCDEARPPSAKKKAHQLKKWVSGIAVGVIAVAHVLLGFESITWAVVTLLLDAVLATHICISAKSLVGDLGLAPNWRHAIRVVVVLTAIPVGTGIIFHSC